MMRVSANELMSAVEKAAVGAGFSYGTGQRLSVATVVCIAQSRVGLSETLRALNVTPCAPCLTETSASWHCETGSVAIAGPALADLKQSGLPIDSSNFDCPELFNAMMAAETPTNFANLEVDLESWQALLALAAKTYVPATEESRNKGAGAGTNDTD